MTELDGFAGVLAETAAASNPTPPGAAAGKREQKPCKFCGKLFGRGVTKNGAVQSPAGFQRRIFCSQSCRGHAQRKEVT